jgi:hypothetical protein
MDRFEYIMVLVSIVVGLGIAHILFGVGGIIDRLSGRGEGIKLSLAHASWLGGIFVWMILFWWWEFRFAELQPEWTVGLYFFLILYAVALFLVAVVLVPRNWVGVTDLDGYFLQHRSWFYSLLLFATTMDFVDAYLKGGWSYIGGYGIWAWGYWLVTIPVAVIGMRSKTIRYHAGMGVAFLVYYLMSAFVTVPTLGL